MWVEDWEKYMRTWQLKCSKCDSELLYGRGYMEQPVVCFPYCRCNVCGSILKTGYKEFIIMTPEERREIRATQKNCEQIRASLERTNDLEYLDKLKEAGFTIYEPTEEDKEKFKYVDFNIYGGDSTEEAINTLYNWGVLIKEEDLDKKTGGYKESVLKENQKAQYISRKVNKISVIVFFLTTAIFCILLGVISPNTALAALGIPIGFLVGTLTEAILKRYYRNLDKKESQKDAEENKIDEDDKAQGDILEESKTAKLGNSLENKKKQDIEALRVLLDEGVITQEEYKKKALEIIDRKD